MKEIKSFKIFICQNQKKFCRLITFACFKPNKFAKLCFENHYTIFKNNLHNSHIQQNAVIFFLKKKYWKHVLQQPG